MRRHYCVLGVLQPWGRLQYNQIVATPQVLIHLLFKALLLFFAQFLQNFHKFVKGQGSWGFILGFHRNISAVGKNELKHITNWAILSS